jgi:MoaA/NifB/PqqE/SkfB family radical SAM enzyme
MLTEQLSFKMDKINDHLILNTGTENVSSGRSKVGFLEKQFVFFVMNIEVVLIACKILKKPVLILKTLCKMKQMIHSIWGGSVQRMQKINGKYYFHLYGPAWPSAARRQMTRKELLHLAYPHTYPDNKSFIFLAITSKCPLRCEHCFEWNNLNKKETFSREELKQIVDVYQQQGVLQIYFSGGEPLVRLHDLIELISYAKHKSDCFVLTSGFNLTVENAKRLKQSGCTGVEISIDHYIPELHNSFRHGPTIFEQAVEGVKASLKAGMITAITVCVTREFIEGRHLMPYLDFAKDLGVHFVLLLEPRAVGHYAGKDVLLKEKHFYELEKFFVQINNGSAYKNYPTVLYNGYHQRRLGCYTGSHSTYIDSAGNVHACPFCHTKSFNIGDVLKLNNASLPDFRNNCPVYGNM